MIKGWIRIEDQLPPLGDSGNQNVLIWLDSQLSNAAVVGWFDGKKCWFVDDYDHECWPSHWQLIIPPT